MDPDLRGSVGSGGNNYVDDIVKVQVLLNLVPAKGGAAPPMTKFGQDTADLRRFITNFQRLNTPYRDGRIDPHGTTWNALLSAARDALGGLPIPSMPRPSVPVAPTLLTQIDAPEWSDWGISNLPLLANSRAVRSDWVMQFGAVPNRAMQTLVFATKPGSGVRYIAVTLPGDCTSPDAYLIYFRHTPQGADYPGGANLLEKGLGDCLNGRMQVQSQISAAGKNVAAVIPIAMPGSRNEFHSSESFVRGCLQEIHAAITGSNSDLPPLLLASYSDGLGAMHEFLNHCGGLRAKVSAIYDFDGILVTRFRGITLSNISGAQVFRYLGSASPAVPKNQSPQMYLDRLMSQSPSLNSRALSTLVQLRTYLQRGSSGG